MLSYAQIKDMSPEEIRATNKKLGKELATKFIVGTLVAVASHFATLFIIDKLEGKKELTAE